MQEADPTLHEKVPEINPETDIHQKVMSYHADKPMVQNVVEFQPPHPMQQQFGQSELRDNVELPQQTENGKEQHVIFHQHIEMEEISHDQMIHGVEHGDSLQPRTSAYLTHPDPPQGSLL